MTSTHPNSPAEEILRAQHVGKVYADGNVAALVDASLTVRRGEYVAIVGPSGSGKSTLLNLLGLLDEPTTGELFFEGRPIAQLGGADRVRSQKIGFVFQSFHLLPMLTALENVQVPMFEGPLPARERAAKAETLLSQVGLAHRANHLPLRLSVGERQRVAIARALANDPVLVLADEPTGNLDSRSGEEILELFARLRREANTTLVVITHDQAVAARADRVLTIRDGRLESDEANR
jgi:putative ABC transport system ATP-binding protein